MNISELAGKIDHTVLNRLVGEEDYQYARATGCRALVASPTSVYRVPCNECIRIAAVIGFPTGWHSTTVKIMEAEAAVKYGATQLDVVLHPNNYAWKNAAAMTAEISAIRDAIGPDIDIAAIFLPPEGASYDLESRINAVAEHVEIIKIYIPTGWVPQSHDYMLKKAVAVRSETPGRDGKKLLVKASGGLSTYDKVSHVFDLGADIVGTSTTKTVLDGFLQAQGRAVV